MKKILFGIIIWFVLQLIIVSSALSGNSLKMAKRAKLNKTTVEQEWQKECNISEIPQFLGSITGVILPIQAFEFIKGEPCWMSSK